MSLFQATVTIITPYVRGCFEALCCHPKRNRSMKQPPMFHVTEGTRKVAGAVSGFNWQKNSDTIEKVDRNNAQRGLSPKQKEQSCISKSS